MSYRNESKAVILYQKIKCYSDLFAAQKQGKFFKKTEFYSSLKNEIINESDYGDVKKIYKLMHIQNLPDLSYIYSMQDTILLFKIFENHATEIMKK